jgi:hypothetical protein
VRQGIAAAFTSPARIRNTARAIAVRRDGGNAIVGSGRRSLQRWTRQRRFRAYPRALTGGCRGVCKDGRVDRGDDFDIKAIRGAGGRFAKDDPFGSTHPPTIRTICRSDDQAFSFCTRGPSGPLYFCASPLTPGEGPPVGLAPPARTPHREGNNDYRSARAVAVNPGTPNGAPPAGFGG